MLSIPRDELPLLLVMGGLIFLSLVVAPIVFFYFLFRSEQRQHDELAGALFDRVEGGVKSGREVTRIDGQELPAAAVEAFERVGRELEGEGFWALGSGVVRVPLREGGWRVESYQRVWAAPGGRAVAVLDWLTPPVLPVGVALKGPEPVQRTLSLRSLSGDGGIWVTRDAVTVQTSWPDGVRVWVVGSGFAALQYWASHRAFLEQNAVVELEPLEAFEAYAALMEREAELVRTHRASFGFLDRQELATIQGVAVSDVEPRLIRAVERIKRVRGLAIGVRD